MFSFKAGRRQEPLGFAVLNLASFSRALPDRALRTLTCEMLFFSVLGCGKDDPNLRTAALLGRLTSLAIRWRSRLLGSRSSIVNFIKAA